MVQDVLAEPDWAAVLTAADKLNMAIRLARSDPASPTSDRGTPESPRALDGESRCCLSVGATLLNSTRLHVWTCLRVDVSTCGRVYVWTCLRVDVSTCGRVYVWTCLRVDVSTCGRVHVW